MKTIIIDGIEYNLTPKVLFKKGDWVVYCNEDVDLITGIEENGYCINNGGYIPFVCASDIRLWTIQDAKNGDVLCCGNEISLYKHDIKNCTKQETTFGGFVYHCCYDGKRFITDSLYSLTEQDKMDIHPATKEQRDILFAKIKEAGYEWDENNKMLKEIVEDEEEPQNYKNQIMSEITDLVKHYIKQKPTCGEAGEDMKEALRTEYEKGRADAFSLMQKEWSEEDEVKINRIVACLENLNVADNDILLKDVDWLKSLKYRYAWKPSDEQMNAFEQVYD